MPWHILTCVEALVNENNVSENLKYMDLPVYGSSSQNSMISRAEQLSSKQPNTAISLSSRYIVST